jgi:lipopolysaccharide heptosyltransferase I
LTRQVAIVRLTSLGDVIHTLPVAAALRDHEPSTRILWLVEEREEILLRDNPAVDEVIVVPLRRWRRQLRSPSGIGRSGRDLRALMRDLRARKFDVVIDVQGWPHKTSPLVWATRAPMRIGFDRRHARQSLATRFTTHQVTPPASAKHIVDQNLALLEPLGIRHVEPVRFPMPEFASSRSVVDEWLREHRIAAGTRVIAILPSTRGAAKLWPVDRYRALASSMLDEDRTACIVAVGGPDEGGLLESAIQGLPSNRAFVFAPAPIPELVWMLRRVNLAVGNDTGPLHVAASAGVPSLGLFGPTRGDRNGPYGSHCAYVQSRTGQMADISLNDVREAIAALKQ